MRRNLTLLGRQLVGVWKQIGLNQRISVVLAGGVVITALLSLSFWANRVDYGLLYGKLDEAEAARVITVLDEQKVPHKIGQAGGAIYVPRDKVHLVRMQLAAKGIPRGDGVGFEIFDKPNFGISDFVQRANYVRAIQGELARTIGQLDEVEAARVMIVMPENRLLLDNHRHASASVFVRTRGHSPLAPAAVNSIRFLVANSVEGLQANQVTVVDNRGTVLSENGDSDSIVGLTSSQLAARRNLEQYLAKKTEGMLETVLGPGQAVVRVAAEINFDSLTRTEEKFDPEGQVPKTTTLNDESTDTTSNSGGGAPGVASNLGSETNTNSASPVSTSHTKKKITNNQYEVNKITSSLTQLAGGLKRVTAAVLVAARYEGTGAARKLVPRKKEELEKLRRIVQNALGAFGAGDNAGKEDIALEEMPFNEQPSETGVEAGKQETRDFWWTRAQNLVYPLLALGILIAFWRMFKKTPVEQIPLGVPVGELTADGNGGFSQTPSSGQPGTNWQRQTEPIVTAEVFSKLVRENPDNMTQAIQNWLAQGNSRQN